jgi:hypothetical protein
VNARLSKDGRYALCARESCGVRLAICLEVPESIADRYPGLARWVWMQPGFSRSDDGRWLISKRVWNRLSRGRPPAYRRGPSDYHATPTLDVGRTFVPELPAVVVCPACGTDQVLEVDDLSLDQVLEVDDLDR